VEVFLAKHASAGKPAFLNRRPPGAPAFAVVEVFLAKHASAGKPAFLNRRPPGAPAFAVVEVFLAKHASAGKPAFLNMNPSVSEACLLEMAPGLSVGDLRAHQPSQLWKYFLRSMLRLASQHF